MRYEDFIIQIGPDHGQGHEVSVLQSPAGDAKGRLRLPRARLAAMTAAGPLRRGIAAGNPADVIDDDPSLSPGAIGQMLFGALFDGPVRRAYDKSIGAVEARGDRGLRIKLRLNPRHAELAELYNLPWELLYDAERQQFLSLSRMQPVVRYLEVPRAIPPLPLPSPLRVVVVIALPQGLESLDLGRERHEIVRAWSTARNVEVTVLETGSAQELRRTLLAQPFHVLHFMGHGDFDAERGEGRLLFEATNGGVAPLSGQSLAMQLTDFKSLRLVFLNACDSARASDHAPFSGVATALVLGGLPAVLAMQLAISDRAAVVFSRDFYRALANGDPVDTAVTEGRVAVFTEQPEGSEWGTPVLFMRTSDGVLFEPGDRRQQAPETHATASPPALKPRPARVDDLSTRPAKSLFQQRPADKGPAHRPARNPTLSGPTPAGRRLTHPRRLRLSSGLLGAGLLVAAALAIGRWGSHPGSPDQPLAEEGTTPTVDQDATTASRSPAEEPIPDDPSAATITTPPPPAIRAQGQRAGSDWLVEKAIDLRLRRVPAGRFTMGSPAGEHGRDDGYELQRTVTLGYGFWIGETEVTQQQWLKLVPANPSGFPDLGVRAPVETVTWFEAAAFANRLSERAGLPACFELTGCSGALGDGQRCSAALFRGLACRGYRLPTEAEWERAARAGGSSAFGNDTVPQTDRINFFPACASCGYPGMSAGQSYPYRPRRVDSLRANAWGIHGLLGNVAEWTLDRYARRFAGAVTDPLDQRGGTHALRAIRGGSWASPASDCRVAARAGLPPQERNNQVGFRLARTISPPP